MTLIITTSSEVNPGALCEVLYKRDKHFACVLKEPETPEMVACSHHTVKTTNGILVMIHELDVAIWDVTEAEYRAYINSWQVTRDYIAWARETARTVFHGEVRYMFKDRVQGSHFWLGKDEEASHENVDDQS